MIQENLEEEHRKLQVKLKSNLKKKEEARLKVMSCPWDKMCFLFCVLCSFLGLAFMFSLWIISNMHKNRGNTLINHPHTHPLASMIICQPCETCF